MSGVNEVKEWTHAIVEIDRDYHCETGIRVMKFALSSKGEA